MSILKYLKPSPKQDSTHDGLLNPHGSLSASLSSATIASAMKESVKSNKLLKESLDNHIIN